LISEMQEGSVVVDVASTRAAASRPAIHTHDNPTYMVHGVVHYCVANMPGAVAQTKHFALTNATIGTASSCRRGRGRGRQTRPALPWGQHPERHCTYKAVAEAHDSNTPPREALLTRRNRFLESEPLFSLHFCVENSGRQRLVGGMLSNIRWFSSDQAS